MTNNAPEGVFDLNNLAGKSFVDFFEKERQSDRLLFAVYRLHSTQR